jgi:hypothetical protein
MSNGNNYIATEGADGVDALYPQLANADLVEMTDEDFAKLFYAVETLDGGWIKRSDDPASYHGFALDLDHVITEDRRRSPWRHEARQLGRQAARDAASWVLDGNQPREHYEWLAQMMADGDEDAESYLPAYPNLSGEFADAPTPMSVAQAAGCDIDTIDESRLEAVCGEWEAGVDETYYLEVERLIAGYLR